MARDTASFVGIPPWVGGFASLFRPALSVAWGRERTLLVASFSKDLQSFVYLWISLTKKDKLSSQALIYMQHGLEYDNKYVLRYNFINLEMCKMNLLHLGLSHKLLDFSCGLVLGTLGIRTSGKNVQIDTKNIQSKYIFPDQILAD